jgi:hypothetical protein
MKSAIVGIATILLSVFVTVFYQDLKQAELRNFELKYVAEELSASASLFINEQEYSRGRIVFDQTEALRAFDHQIKTLLHLDNGFNPLTTSYWTEKVTYRINFYDDSNTAYPYLFTDPDTMFTYVVTEPTVVVTLNTGKARYRISFLDSTDDNIRSAAHEWKNRN